MNQGSTWNEGDIDEQRNRNQCENINNGSVAGNIL
jgi:hypothetical protein